MVTARPAYACTGLVWFVDKNEVISACSMGWWVKVATNLRGAPRGMRQNGQSGPNKAGPASGHGDVSVSKIIISPAEGMNGRGPNAQLHCLLGSHYRAYRKNTAAISLAALAQYAPNNFATFDDGVTARDKESFFVTAYSAPGQQCLAAQSISRSDALGESAIFEYIGGRFMIHLGRQYQVMTDSPQLSEKFWLNSYWQEIGEIDVIPKSEHPDAAAAKVFAAIRNALAPFGTTKPAEPNISSPRWRPVSGLKRVLYFFECTPCQLRSG